MKQRAMSILMCTVITTTGTLIACGFWYLVTLLTEHRPVLTAQIPYMTLWQILSVGVLCGVGTELIMRTGESHVKLRHALHCAYVTGVVMTCGYFYHWYSFNWAGVLGMCLTIAAVYAFSYTLLQVAHTGIAKQMTRKLDELKRRK